MIRHCSGRVVRTTRRCFKEAHVSSRSRGCMNSLALGNCKFGCCVKIDRGAGSRRLFSSSSRGGALERLSDALLESTKRRYLTSGKSRRNDDDRAIPSTARLVDVTAPKKSDDQNRKKQDRLPNWLIPWEDEFPCRSADADADGRRVRAASNRRIVEIAAHRILEPPTLQLMGATAIAVLAIGAVEGTLLLADDVIFLDGMSFVSRYACANLLPSCLWETVDAALCARSMGLDPEVVLRQFDSASVGDASAQLRLVLLSTLRSLTAGYMLLAQFVRAASIGASAVDAYKDQVRLGKEAPLLPGDGKGMIIRLCGHYSDATTVSLRRMAGRIFPVYEDPQRLSHLVSRHSAPGGRRPVYWHVRPGSYGSDFSWRSFPVDEAFFLRTGTGQRILLLEADASNSNDPLALGDLALDLKIDDAAQALHRIQGKYKAKDGLPPFRTLRVFLGNSLETSRSGGGYSYTLRHRIRYAKEVDVLIDSRAPVLQEVLEWCHQATAWRERVVLFQTSSRDYFLSLQLLLRQYGFDVYDPLDLRVGTTMEKKERKQDEADPQMAELVPDNANSRVSGSSPTSNGEREVARRQTLLQVLLEDSRFTEGFSDTGFNADSNAVESTICQKAKRERQRRITNLSKLPRLVYYGTTAETVNAVEALVKADEVDAANCCALVDKQEGVRHLEHVLSRTSNLVKRGTMQWGKKDQSNKRMKEEHVAVSSSPPSHDQRMAPEEEDFTTLSGLHIICSSVIYDDLFRQVRQWARMGYAAKDMQKELDLRYRHMLEQSLEVRETVASDVTGDLSGLDSKKDATDPAKEDKASTDIVAKGP